jgi:hypothetical protein
LMAGRYNAWRPQMENTLMRAGIAKRDYAEKCADWAALASAVENWSREEELESINYALGRSSGAKSGKNAASAASVDSGRGSEKEQRRGAIEAVARMRKAFTLLYQALPDDLRRLIAGVPQGYAYGLWSWLEERYQSTEQDNIGDLWEEFTRLEMNDGEAFEAYKARVDQTFALLEHAKDKPSPGLYSHRLLWKLTPNYNPAVLALKASGKLKDASKIDWSEVVIFVNNHERSESRLAGNGDDVYSSGFASAATRMNNRSDGRRGGSVTKADRKDGVKCYNCGELGHIASGCRAGNKNTRRREETGQDPEDDRGAAGGSRREYGQMARQRSRFDNLSSESDFASDEERFGYSACLMSNRGVMKSGEQREAANAVRERQNAVSTTTDAEAETTQLASSTRLVSFMPLKSRVSSVGCGSSGLHPEHEERLNSGDQHRQRNTQTLQQHRSKGKSGVAKSALKKNESDDHSGWKTVGSKARRGKNITHEEEIQDSEEFEESVL